MKNLKKLSRKELKKVNGGRLQSLTEYPDMCHGNSDCAPYGLSCGVYEGKDENGWWTAYRCI